MKALVAGANGETGRRIVRVLVEQGIAVRALVRDAEVARDRLPPEAELVVGDVLEPASLERAIAGCTVLLCATGARPSLDPFGPLRVDYEGTKNLVDLAKAQGIEQFVLVSSLCVSRFFHPLNLFWLILFWKKQAEAYLRSSGLTYTIVRPGGLKNDDLDTPIVFGKADSLFEGSIPRLQVARVCVAALGEPSARDRTVEVVAREDAPVIPWPQAFAALGN